jgi:hypothetical protein
MRNMQRAIVVPCCRVSFDLGASDPLQHRRDVRDDAMRKVKIYLASWRHSADTGANARRSKVIDGRIYVDRCFFVGLC